MCDCNIEHAEIIHNQAPVAVMVWIIICYWIFAIQLAWQTNWRNISSGIVATMVSLIFVIILSSIADYMASIFPYELLELRLIVHILEAVAVALLVLFNQASVIARILERN